MLVREPVYQQLNNALREMLISGDHKVGDKFLTEREICQRFAVSRTTANKAISNMVSEGVLEFKKGLGTFVRTLPLDYDLRSLSVSHARHAKPGEFPGLRCSRSKRRQPAPSRSKLRIGSKSVHPTASFFAGDCDSRTVFP